MRNTKPINILITGGCGFIGHHLARKLYTHACSNQIPMNILLADIASPPESTLQLNEHSKDRGVSIAYERIDVSDRSALMDLLAFYNIDVVYHLAAYFGGMTILEAEEHLITSTNSRINNTVAEAMMQHASRHDPAGGRLRFFFSSSQCVYPDQMPGDAEWSESDAWRGIAPNLYGMEKRLAENVFLAMSRHVPMDVVVARFGNCYGPESQYKNKQAKAPAALCWKAYNANDGGFIEIYGDGSAVRSYIYIDDLLNGILAICPPSGWCAAGQVFNLSSPEYVTVRVLATLVAQASGKRLDIQSVRGPVGNHARYVSCRKLAEFASWKCATPLACGLGMLYRWICAVETKTKSVAQTHSGAACAQESQH